MATCRRAAPCGRRRQRSPVEPRAGEVEDRPRHAQAELAQAQETLARSGAERTRSTRGARCFRTNPPRAARGSCAGGPGGAAGEPRARQAESAVECSSRGSPKPKPAHRGQAEEAGERGPDLVAIESDAADRGNRARIAGAVGSVIGENRSCGRCASGSRHRPCQQTVIDRCGHARTDMGRGA